MLNTETTANTGRGIFAKHDIPEGNTIGLITGEEHYEGNQTLTDVHGNENWIGIGKGTWIDPDFPFSFVNHSCNPNAGIQGSIEVVAMRQIEEGEEITIDYSITEEDLRWRLLSQCLCHQPGCRGEIKSIQFLPRETFEKYLPHIPDYFARAYRSYHHL